MDFVKLDTLKEKYEGLNWAKQWLPVRKALDVMSYLGHIVLIAFGYSFLVSLLMDTPLGEKVNEYVLIVMSLIVLSVFELLKRELFHQTVFEIIKNGKWTNELKLMLVFCLAIVATSFFIAMSGAEEFSSKSATIETKKEKNIEAQTDSIKVKYKPEMERIRKQSDKLLEMNDKLMNQMEETEYEWYKQTYMNNIKSNTKQIDEYKKQLDEIQGKINKEIAVLKKEEGDKSSKSLDKNKDVSYQFVIISIFMEILILTGIYFHTYHEKKTVKEYNEIIVKSPNIKDYKKHLKMLYYLYKGGKKNAGDSAPTILQMLKMIDYTKEDEPITQKEFEDFLALCTYLEIIEAQGPGIPKMIKVSTEEAEKIFMSHFNIK